MCGRYVMQDSISEIAREFGVDEVTVDAERPPSWNVAPTQPVLAVASSRDGRVRRLGELRWGLIPSWAKDPRIGARMINARAETLATGRAFGAALQRRRCLIPASGFYEWHKRDEAAPKKQPRRPVYLHPADGSILAFAGLWEVWHDAEGGAIRSATIITTSANAVMAPIHDRMPVILARSAWDRWLEPAPLEPDERTALLVPAPDEALVAYDVSDRVNKATNDGPELLDPAPQIPAGGPLPARQEAEGNHPARLL